MTESTNSSGGGGLLQPGSIGPDCALLRRALRERWPVPIETQTLVLSRLRSIIEKTEVTTMTAQGLVSTEGPADSNAVAAARVLVAMTAQNQADDHLTDKNSRLDEGKATERFDGVEIVVPGLPRAQ